MNNLTPYFIITLLFFSCNTSPKIASDNNSEEVNLNLIPTPKSVNHNKQWSNIKNITPSPEAMENLGVLNDWVKDWSLSNGNEENLFTTKNPDKEPGAYELIIRENIIKITYGDQESLANALSTLRQLLLFNQNKLPVVTIEDTPAFSYRGMHLDVARHFYTIPEIKKYIDYISLYKFNKFHWHLTDDQGWRIEIKKYPKLQEISSKRPETLIGHYNDLPQQYDGIEYGGYYTHEQIKEVVAYAATRGIEVIPEIDIPGHSTAILAAYPEFGCTGNKITPATKWGVFFDILCPKEETFDFLQNVFQEISTLFPSKYIHIGGDECPKDHWEQSEFCQELMHKEGIANELELQSYFVARVEKMINEMGKQIIGWDEILEGGIGNSAIIMSWRGIKGGIEAANKGNQVIMTPTSHCYFDYYQSEREEEPLSIGGFLPFQKVYKWSPLPTELDSSAHKHILGGQGNVWTEYMKDFQHVEYMMMTRMITLSEVLWGKHNSTLENFTQLLLQHTNYWSDNGTNIANHLLDLKTKVLVNKESGTTVQLSSNFKDLEFFALAPDLVEYKKLEENNLSLSAPGTYKFYGQREGKKGNISSITYDPHLGNNASITLKHQASSTYSGNGPQSILNGIEGPSEKYGGSEWLGFDGKNCHATINFFQEEELSSVKLKFFNGEGQWIYLPKKVDIYSSTGDKKVLLKSTDNIESSSKIAKVNLSFPKIKTSSLIIEIENHGMIEVGKQGAGHLAWLFVDEIKIN